MLGHELFGIGFVQFNARDDGVGSPLRSAVSCSQRVSAIASAGTASICTDLTRS